MIIVDVSVVKAPIVKDRGAWFLKLRCVKLLLTCWNYSSNANVASCSF